ncbi:MAG: MFS transporter [Flavobacteriales bacterium]|nr:MFS transporter [Flavobacteriales bacterium]
MQSQQHNPATLFLLILAGESVFFLPFVLPRVFRPTLLSAFDMTNLELGTAFSAYGLVAFASYFFGGPLADRFPARTLISLSLALTGMGGFALAVDPGFVGLVALYAFWGFSTIFLLWAAMIRATREWGGKGFQGRAFGFLESGRGLTSAVIGSLALFAFSTLTSQFAEGDSVPIHEVIFFSSVLVMLIGVAVFFWMPKDLGANEAQAHKIAPSEVMELLRNPTIWLQGAIIVCAYVGYKMTDDFSLYANEVLDFNEVDAAGVGTSALWLRPVFALAAGVVADRFGGIRTIAACFMCMIIGGVLIATGWLDVWTLYVLATMVFTVMGIYGLRGIYFAVMDVSKVSIRATGTAVGIMSLLGYTPDIFISPTMGFLLDHYPGAQGHHYVFGLISGFAVMGLIATLILNKSTATQENASTHL